MAHSGFHFIPNLKPYTLHRGTGNRRFDGYLLSIDYARQFLDLARDVVRDGGVLCADNGNVDVVRSLIASNTAPARALEIERRGRFRHGGNPGETSGELPSDLHKRYRELAATVRAKSETLRERARIEEIVRAQNALSPTYLIGPEDFTVSVLSALGIRPGVVELGSAFYRELARISVALAVDTEVGRYGPSAPVFACVHASDYDTARIGGFEAGKAGIAGIAASLVSALQDRAYISTRIEEGRVVQLGRTMPRPYVAVAEILAGLHEGYVAACGRRPRFHGLGMGTPILLPLLAALGDALTYTATDSTAPIVDGWSSPTISLYVDDPAPLKYKAHKIAETWLAGGRGWDCPCPYCRGFDRACQPRIDEARRWWREHNPGSLTADSMRGDSPLADWLPLLGNAKDPGLRLGAAMARVGHNHWVLQRIETEARRRSASSESMLEWVDDVVARYLVAPSDPAWKAAVTTAWQIVRRTAEGTRHARPTPLAA